MRIGIIASPYIAIPPVKYGGTERVIECLIKGLLEEGHEPILFGTGDSQVGCEIVPIVERAVKFPQTREELPEHLEQIARINQKTTRLLRQNFGRLDIIHAQGSEPQQSFDMLPFKDFPNLTTLNSTINFKNLSYYRERRELHYVAISDSQQKVCPELQYTGRVYNGLDPSQFPIVDKPQDYLCFLGRFDNEKRPDQAIELALLLGKPIKIAGKVDYFSGHYFEQVIQPYLNHPLVEYLGELDHAGKVELISNALCNLHPVGFREPFGLTVVEAAYCGTPTLAISRGSMPELIEDGRTGLLTESFVEGFYKIDKCFEMDRTYIASRARMLFNYTTMAREYVKAYQRVLDAFATKESTV